MRVVTWNLWWRFGPWQPRQGAIIEELNRVDPDIALLQEVWAADGVDQVDNLMAATGRYGVRTRSDDGEPQGFGNAILSRWPIEEAETIRLPTIDGGPSYRTALACWVHRPLGPVLVTVTHLAWQYDRSHEREAQLAEVVDLIERHRTDADSAYPAILGGDLNATPDSTEIRRLTGRARPYRPGLVFTDSWSALSDDPGHTWVRSNPHCADAQWPRRRLDYVLVAWPRPKPTGNPLSAALIGVEPHDEMVPSDHYGVVVELDDRPQADD